MYSHNSANSLAISILEDLDIPTKHCKKCVLTFEVGHAPTATVVYSLAHIPVFNKFGDITKFYILEPKAKEDKHNLMRDSVAVST